MYLDVTDQSRKCGSTNLKPCLPFQIAVWNSYRGMNLTESNRDKNNNVTDSLANRTLIVTTILVRRKVKQKTAQGEGGEYIWDEYRADRGLTEGNTMREERETVGSH